MTTRIDVTIAATTAVMTDAMTIVGMTTKTDAKIARMIAVTMIVGTTDVMTGDSKTTTTNTITTVKNGLHHHHLKGATPPARSKWPNERLTSSLVVTKRPKATDRNRSNAREIGQVNTENRSLCVGLNSQSLSPIKIIGFTSPTTGPTRWSLTP
jgi:hypothetical protein